MIFKERLPMDADSYEEVVHYFQNRAKQLLQFGVKFRSLVKVSAGVHANIEYKGEIYSSLYVYKSFRGKNYYHSYASNLPQTTFLTTESCGIVDYLLAKKIKHIVVGKYLERPAYKMIQNYYGDKKANRSGVYLMNHIDEGLYILENIGANLLTKDAYCLHPILQSDEDLKKNYTSDVSYNSSFTHFNIHPTAFILTMEYRRVANAYLSAREISSIEEIELSVLPEVNQMLIADKVQNRKDFELYHIDTHPRSKELQQYFKNWLERLGVSEEQYQQFKQELSC